MHPCWRFVHLVCLGTYLCRNSVPSKHVANQAEKTSLFNHLHRHTLGEALHGSSYGNPNLLLATSLSVFAWGYQDHGADLC